MKNTTQWLRNEGENADIVLASRIRLARNIPHFPFVSKMSEEKSVQLESFIKEKLDRVLPMDKYHYFILNDLSETDLNFLSERHLISKEHVRGEGRRSVTFSPDEKFSIMINEEDHLRLQVIFTQEEAQSSWEKLEDLIDQLEAIVDFSFDRRFGYLTACPTNAGTGLRVSTMLHLPALQMTNQMGKIYQAADAVNLVIRGFFGEGTAGMGDFFQVSNQITLGKNEEELIQTVESVVPQILKYERNVRRKMLKSDRGRLEEHCHKALATIKEESEISFRESLRLLSAIRLGVNLELIPEVAIKKINEGLILSHDSHLKKSTKGHLGDDETWEMIRARFLQNLFTN